jgi:hypothetical protein
MTSPLTPRFLLALVAGDLSRTAISLSPDIPNKPGRVPELGRLAFPNGAPRDIFCTWLTTLSRTLDMNPVVPAVERESGDDEWSLNLLMGLCRGRSASSCTWKSASRAGHVGDLDWDETLSAFCESGFREDVDNIDADP